MALQKEIEYPSGASADYHRIVYTEVDWEGQRARVGFVSYVTQATRDDGKPPLVAAPSYFNLPLTEGEALPFTFTDNIAAVSYDEMKKLAEMAGATDV